MKPGNEKVELAKKELDVKARAKLQASGEDGGTIPPEGVGFNRGQDVVTMKGGGLGRVVRNHDG